ncbi:MAG: hypothetical protein IPJ65_14455 [Archangiaceae bacterium]|nr:hypothetical protein [Archangiaceae bacterium]
MTVCACAVLSSTPARADLFSPGELIEPHAHLEGVSRCKVCHPSGDALSGRLCLDCHTELAGQVSRGRGFHGRLPKAELDACQKCHRDHLGREQPPTEWGPGGVKGFDHSAVGWPLERGHAKLQCSACHQKQLSALPEVKAWAERYPSCRTFLGAPRACSACHFDEHRGGASQECERCHGADDWKKTPKYDHQRASAYPLLGKHRKVLCSGCHPTAEDEKALTSASPKPLAMTYLKLAPIPHERCITCHEDDDVHQGRYGARCEGCHSEASWKTLKAGAMDRIDHDRYRYPLEGAHAQVACDACHGPWPGLLARPKYKGIAFARCADCHHDAHFGQLDKKNDCDACHTVQSFSPPPTASRSTSAPAGSSRARTARCRAGPVTPTSGRSPPTSTTARARA